jgi:hypothetical protein
MDNLSYYRGYGLAGGGSFSLQAKAGRRVGHDLPTVAVELGSRRCDGSPFLSFLFLVPFSVHLCANSTLGFFAHFATQVTRRTLCRNKMIAHALRCN